uniref:Serine/threonine-protein phosphatase 2A regulatory subunit B'' subunit gamma n=1 Tax=Mesocestoides corti TaxID=53468 RepID=A0A5K3FYD9_MESCO
MTSTKDVSFPDLEDLLPKAPPEDDTLALKLREEARAVLLEKKNFDLLDNDELAALWNLLEKHKSPLSVDGKVYLTYAQFLNAGKEACPKAARYFTATVFAKLCRGDRLSRVNILTLFNYAMKTIWLQQTRIGISLYDVTGDGYLRESDLENYICELIPSLTKLRGVDSAFKTFYVCTATRKFFFFLDPLRAGRVRISDILASGYLDAMLELRETNITLEQLEANWFSFESAKRVYASYLHLDDDRNGMLSRQELSGYNNGTLTDAFLDRVFQECLTYEGEMDYKAYLDFVLAMENRHEPQAIIFLFRILDLGGQGRLCSRTLEYFFSAVEERLGPSPDVPRSCDVLNEIFDMVKPRHPDYITLDDLLRSGKGDTVLSILFDIQAFFMYENREALAAGAGGETVI